MASVSLSVFAETETNPQNDLMSLPLVLTTVLVTIVLLGILLLACCASGSSQDIVLSATEIRQRYNSEQARLETFRRSVPWRLLQPGGKDMASAGFIFLPNSTYPDNCMCFSCGLQQSVWAEHANPIEIHYQLNPHCEFIKTKRSSQAQSQYQIAPVQLTDYENVQVNRHSGNFHSG